MARRKLRLAFFSIQLLEHSADGIFEVLVLFQLLPILSLTLVLTASADLDLTEVRDRTFKLIAEKLPGVTIKLRPVPLPRALAEANSGKVDGDAGRIKNIVELYPEKLENLIRVKEPIFQLAIYVFHRRGEPVELRMDELGNSRLAFVTGIAYLHHKIPAINQVHVLNDAQGMNLLKQKRIDAYLKLVPSADFITRLADQNPDLEVETEPFRIMNVYIHMHKKHLQLIPKMEQAIRELRREGKLNPVQAIADDEMESE